MLTWAALSLALLAAGAAATCRPAWYTPATVDQSRLASDKRALVDLLDSIGDALNAGQSIDLELHQDQLNRWIAARDEFGPILGWQIELEGVSFPQVLLLDANRLRIGATAQTRVAAVVLSAAGRLELTPGGLLVHLESVRAGTLPIPRRSLLRPLPELLEADAGEWGSLSGDTIRLPNEWTWPNGKRRFRIARLEVSGQVARLTLEPIQGRP